MLRNLYIKNYILIDDINIEFDNKLNIITGETGAGKSILLDAISFCITGKSGKDIIKNNSETCLVTVSFSSSENVKSTLQEYGIEIDGDEDIHITRSLSRDGKKRCLINNQPVTQKAIDSISENLLTIYGQHSFSSLFKVSSHQKILDDFLGNKQIFQEVSLFYKEVKSIEERLRELENKQKSAIAESEYLNHVYKELSSAKIQESEEEELSELRAKLQQSSKQRQFIVDLHDSFKESNFSGNISSMIRIIGRSNSEMFTDLSNVLDKLYENINEAEGIIEKLQKFDDSHYNLDEIEERLFLIRSFARKYNIPANQLNSYLEDVRGKIQLIENSDTEIKKLEKSYSIAKEQYLEKSRELSSLRKKASIEIEKSVSGELEKLQMPGCDFKVEILDSNNYTEVGIDSVKFIARTNLGMPYGPIDKIASGGEMARFMLATQVVLFKNNENFQTVVFDEIDTGIGGVVADSVGSRLKALSEHAQVIAITHQPQVASKSTNHIFIKKSQNFDLTSSYASILSKEEKVNEIARMISGKVITELSKKAAKELIEGIYE